MKRTECEERVFDGEVLIERLMGDRELARDILHGFLRELPEQIAAMRCALDQGDVATARRHAHSIRGAAGSIGATVLERAAAEVERGGADPTTGGPGASLVSTLDIQFGALKAEVRDLGGLWAEGET